MLPENGKTLQLPEAFFHALSCCVGNGAQLMINVGMDLDADILRVGYHGSSTSSSETFPEAFHRKSL